MRRTTLIALAVLALSLTLCFAGSAAVDRAVGGAGAMLRRAERAAALGDIDGAKAEMRALGSYWAARERALELITSHDALFDARGGIADALLCLEHSQKPEFFRACAGVSVALERLRVAEALRLANLY